MFFSVCSIDGELHTITINAHVTTIYRYYQKVLPLDAIVAALKLGEKYHIRQAQAEALRRLRSEFSIWYGDSRPCLCGEPTCLKSSCNPQPKSGIFSEVGINARWKLLDAFAVARANGLLHLLPMLFEKIAANMEVTGDNQNRDFMLEGWKRDDGTSTDMCIEDKLLCLNGLRAIQMARVSTWGSLKIPTSECNSIDSCMSTKELVFANLAVAPSVKPIIDDLCEECKLIANAAYKTWDCGNRDALPAYINLPVWRDLLRCKDETFIPPPFPRSRISFPDGSLSIRVDGKEYRVHRGLLAQYSASEIFHPKHGTAAVFVELHGDRARDWECVLRWVYDHR